MRDHFGGGIFCYFAQFLRIAFYGKIKRICIKSMTIGAVSIIKKAAQKSDKSVSEMIEWLIREHLT